jgi:hypothetical protein
MDYVKGQDDFSADLLFTMDAPCKMVFLEASSGRKGHDEGVVVAINVRHMVQNQCFTACSTAKQQHLVL